MGFNNKKGKQITVNSELTNELYFVEGAGIDINVIGPQVTISSNITQYTDENATDAVANALIDSTTIDFTYDDVLNTISANVKQNGITHTQLQNIGTNSHAQIDTHIASTSNPHSVTKTQVGLSNVENTALSTWTGSTNITTVGTLSSGVIPVNLLSPSSIPIANGGTGLTSTPTNGQLLIGNGTGYTLSTLSAGTGITITNGPGTIQIAAPTSTSPYFDDDGGSPTIAPSATGFQSVAIGDGATVTASNGFAFGSKAESISSGPSLALGSSEKTSSGSAYTRSSGDLSIAIGCNKSSSTGSATTVSSGLQSIAIGCNSTTNSTTLQTLASGDYSIAIGLNAKATAEKAICIGDNAAASTTCAIALGQQTVSNNTNTIAIGSAAQATGANSIAFGNSSIASATDSIALGSGANATHNNSVAFACSTAFPNEFAIIKTSTTASGLTGNSTFRTVSLNGATGYSSISSVDLTASGTDIIISDKTCYTFEAFIVAKVNGANTGAGFQVTGVIRRDGTTAFIGTPTVTVLGRDNATFNVTCTTSSNKLIFTCTYTNSDLTFWNAIIKLNEIVTTT